MPAGKIILGHGSGGSLMHGLIRGLFLKKLINPVLAELADAARINYGEPLAFTTDSFVVSPLWFPGGDIGKLAVCGTINDLVMLGAVPEYLSLSLIIEEGLEYRLLERIIDSIAQAAHKAKVCIATGDTKVVEKGAADKIFINTSGIGRIIKGVELRLKNIRPGDKVIVTGEIGRHGLAVLARRKELDLGFAIRSDSAALNSLLIPLLKRFSGIRFMRDPTRGGVATTLNEIAQGSGLGIVIKESALPVSRQVKAASELLGIDPLYLANEGQAIIITSPQSENKVLAFLKQHPLGRKAAIIGEVVKHPQAQVVLETIFGSQRLIDMLTSEPLPRIC